MFVLSTIRSNYFVIHCNCCWAIIVLLIADKKKPWKLEESSFSGSNTQT